MIRETRLRRREDFQRVLSAGRSKSDSLLILKTAPGSTESSRIGIVTSKKLGCAVVRNRVRRRLREILRKAEIKNSIDAVFIARSSAASVPFAELEASACNLMKRVGLVSS
ncbi:ribonuclease P protein component [Dehalogenimonas alkenigignens]|uniref:Ribonuclease P protein component n=1 Tax=Dehalogenimonas alkenigignens TaxID=1217799 RepID=A0A0W0GIS5_9CHLR|nr:ribonuclease P protein component [Dehalogenimonas alkenigignens]KTB48435.1 ribonuclease P protein component, eubacterial [Dehalogenimonas alkenigignens]PVV85111.1 ribonuclease P protein component [Dehalogenimonas alkenigignens]